MNRTIKYFSIVILLLILAFGIQAMGQNLVKENQKSLFDGTSLAGWELVNPTFQDLWYVKDSTIHCGDGKRTISANTYLYTTDEYEDFEFRCLFRITGDPSTGMINSGIQYRSQVHDGKMVGY